MIDASALLSAVLFCVSNVVDTVYFSKFRTRGHFDYEQFKQLDPEYIQQEFEFRSETRGLEIASSLLNAAAWFSLVAPVFQLAWILSHGGNRQLSTHSMMCALVIGGSLAEFLSTLFFIGGTNTSEWLAKEFNLSDWTSTGNDDIGWRALEVTFMMLRGMRLWVDAIEWIFLYLIMTLIFVSNFTSPHPPFKTRWAAFGLFAAAFCVVDFAAEILRFQDWRTFSRITFYTSVALRVFVLPIWLLGLSMTLPAAQKAALPSPAAFAAPSGQQEAQVNSPPQDSPVAEQSPALI